MGPLSRALPVSLVCGDPLAPRCAAACEGQGGGGGSVVLLTKVMSLEAAAALIWRLGWRMELLQSRARANVPTALQHTHTHTHTHTITITTSPYTQPCNP